MTTLNRPKKVCALFDPYADEAQSLWVTDIVLVELVGVLKLSHDSSVKEICSTVHTLTKNATVYLESHSCMSEALVLYEQGPAGFADCQLGVKARRAGCDALRTVNKK